MKLLCSEGRIQDNSIARSCKGVDFRFLYICLKKFYICPRSHSIPSGNREHVPIDLHRDHFAGSEVWRADCDNPGSTAEITDPPVPNISSHGGVEQESCCERSWGPVLFKEGGGIGISFKALKDPLALVQFHRQTISSMV